MPSHRLPADYQESLFDGAARFGDPGNAGTLAFTLKGYAQCPLTVGASNETRVLDTLTLSGYPVGQLLYVYLQTTTGGAVSITGSADGTVTLTTAGDYAVFIVSPTSVSANQWRTVVNPLTQQAARGLDVVTKTSVTDSATLTSASLLGGWVEGTPTAVADYTLPLASALAAALPGAAAKVGDSFIFTVDNIAAGTANFDIRLVTNTGVTLIGDMTIPPQRSRSFRVVFTSTSAYTVLTVDANRMYGFNDAAATASVTLTPAQVLSGVISVTTGGSTGTYTFPTAANMVAALGNPKVGAMWDLYVNNQGSGNATLAAGGATLEGAAAALTIATTVCKICRILITNVTASSEAYTVFVVS